MTPPKILCTELDTGSGVKLYHTGPALDHGPLPSIFYFALSGPDSLTKDPYNQPVQFLSGKWVRFFSLTLPAHEEGLDPTKALAVWAEEMADGKDCLGRFFDHALHAVHYAIAQKLIDPNKLGIAGLSRGGFIASHLAAREERFRAILQFAPLTKISQAREFRDLHQSPLIEALSLDPIASAIANRHIRIYIGNKDTRTSTRACFDFVETLVAASTLRSPQIELILTPSIGLMGHGTSAEIFKQGAEWLAECLK